jgi:4-amino-4-deoxy-L-arabinose transferase-like glycosyltransferase
MGRSEMQVRLTKFPKPGWVPTAVFLVSILIVSIFWMVLPVRFRATENTDYVAYYEPVARNILNGTGIVSLDGTTAIRYPPGYPLLLASILFLSRQLRISEATGLSVFAILCLGSASVLIFQLSRSVWGITPALISSLVWATYPLALWYSQEPGTELPFTAIFYGAFCLFWYTLLRKSRAWPIYFLIGLLVGLAMLIRPIAIGAGVLMAVILWLYASHLRPRLKLTLIAVLLLGNVVAVAPWEGWMYSRTGKVILLSNGGVPSIRDGLTYGVSKGARQGGSVPADVAELMNDIRAKYEELRSLSDIAVIMSKELLIRPVAVVKLFLLKVVRSWYGTDSRRLETPLMLLQLIYLALILWATKVAWKLGGTARELTVSVWLMAFYFWGMTIVALSIARYMVPAMGLLFTLLPAVYGPVRAKMTSLENRREVPGETCV